MAETFRTELARSRLISHRPVSLSHALSLYGLSLWRGLCGLCVRRPSCFDEFTASTVQSSVECGDLKYTKSDAYWTAAKKLSCHSLVRPIVLNDRDRSKYKACNSSLVCFTCVFWYVLAHELWIGPPEAIHRQHVLDRLAVAEPLFSANFVGTACRE